MVNFADLERIAVGDFALVFEITKAFAEAVVFDVVNDLVGLDNGFTRVRHNFSELGYEDEPVWVG